MLRAVSFNPANVAITGGTVKVNDGSAAAPSYSFASDPDTGMYRRAAVLSFAVDSNDSASLDSDNGEFRLGSGAAFSWSSTGGAGTAVGDLRLFRDAANTLAQRNGTNAQAFRVSNTHTDASNYERGVFDWTTTANVLTIGAKAAGTGAQRAVEFDASKFDFKIGNAYKIAIDGDAFRPAFDGVQVLGSSTNHWKGIYIDYTNTATVGAVTINKAAGRVRIAAAGTSVVVTNSLVTAASKVFCTIAANDATAVLKNVVPAAGSFTITLNAATTAETTIDFFVVNAD